MSSRNKALNLLGTLFLLLLLAACGKNDTATDWSKKYRPNAGEPYDLMVFHELLREREPGAEILTSNFSRKINAAEKANYIQIQPIIALDSHKIQALRAFVNRGNNAYFISSTSPYQLFSSLYDGYSTPYYGDTSKISIEVSFEGSDVTYPFKHQFEAEPAAHNWSRLYLYDTLFSDTAGYPEALSYFEDTCINFFKVSFGEGSFYFHTQPVLFTNLMLKTESGFEHLQRVFEELNPEKVYWDVSYEYRQPEANGNRTGNGGGGNASSKSPFRIFFNHLSLKCGWYVLLATVLLFLLFRSKRQQRLIPVILPNQNESLEFARNMGNLYFTSKNHKHIALEMYDIFLTDARNRYQVDTNLSAQEIFKQLAKKSGLGQDIMDELFENFKMRFSEYSKNEQLIQLYNSLTNYYKSRK